MGDQWVCNMSKELTNRQLAEAVGYALEKAEANLNDSLKRIEEERKKIESFSIDTNTVKSLFEEGNKVFEQTTREAIKRLEQIKKNRPLEVEIKEWFFYGFMLFAVVLCVGLAINFKLSNDKLEEENKALKSTISLVNKYFRENPKAKEQFEKWNQ